MKHETQGEIYVHDFEFNWAFLTAELLRVLLCRSLRAYLNSTGLSRCIREQLARERRVGKDKDEKEGDDFVEDE